MKKWLTLFVSVMVVFATLTSVFAASVSAPVKSVSVGDYNFKLDASAFTIDATNEIGAQGGIYEQDFKKLPTGYLGARIGIYSGTSLITGTNFRYTDQASSSIGVVINEKIHNIYSSVPAKSESRIYEGNEYLTYESNFTPYLNNPNAQSFNKNNERYGSSLYTPESELDLIEAIGINGIKGYVRKTELNGPEPKTPEEALTQQAKIKSEDTLIPVYDKEGVEIVDMFRIVQGTTFSYEDKK